ASFCPSCEKYSAHRRCLSNAVGANIAVQILHGVINRESGCDVASDGVDIEFNVFFWIFGFEEEQLCNNNVGHDVCDLLPNKDNSIFKESGVDVHRSFSTTCIFDHIWY